MEVQVKQLRDALELLSPVVPRKATIPALTYFRLGGGRAVASDLEVTVAIDLDGADEDLLLPAKDVLKFLKYTPGMGTAQITWSKKGSQGQGRVTITSGGMDAAYDEVPGAEDYPPLPEAPHDGEGVINGELLMKALSIVAPYAATETDRPVLHGVYLNTEDGLELAAADGFRLAWEPVAGRLNIPPTVVPLKAVEVLEDLWKKAAAPDLSGVHDVSDLATATRLMRFDRGENHLRIGFGLVTMFATIVQGTFPNYRNLIPTELGSPVTVFGPDMQRAVAQVGDVASKGSGIVRLVWGDGKLMVSSKQDESEVSVSVPAQFDYQGKVALDVKYLTQYFKARAGFVTITPSGGKSGAVTFTYNGRAHMILMPMAVQW